MEQEKLTEGLTLLGRGATEPARRLETFPNRHPGREYWVTLETDEFTCVCPMTGQPDFATITIRYMPDQRVVESKSLKYTCGLFGTKGFFTSTSRTRSSTTSSKRWTHCAVRS